jgi:diguanylate cyclase (GGDEF)-like protein
MSVLSLPDIAGMLILMSVLGWFRKRHRDERVDGWLLGLTFILVEMIATSVMHGARWVPVLTRVVGLDAYLLAAVTFGWAARRELLPGKSQLPQFLLPAVPLLVLTTLYGLNVTLTPSLIQAYVLVVVASLVLGLVYLLFLVRTRRGLRSLLVLIHLTMWLPMLYFATQARLREVVYWGLACLYVLVAFSFRRRARAETIGPWVIMISFVIWAGCFLAYPLADGHVLTEGLIEQIWNLEKFFVVIGMLLVLLEDETERRRDEAMHDSLTGLPNRRLFDDRFAQALERSRRTGLSAALFAIDLNGFKAVNDTLGHQTGDLVLKRVAERLKRKVRGADTVARVGGDEFVVVVNDLVQPANCAKIAEALRSAIQGVSVPGTQGLRVGGSVGFAIYPDDSIEAAKLFEIADARMYDEKKSESGVAVGRPA